MSIVFLFKSNFLSAILGCLNGIGCVSSLSLDVDGSKIRNSFFLYKMCLVTPKSFLCWKVIFSCHQKLIHALQLIQIWWFAYCVRKEWNQKAVSLTFFVQITWQSIMIGTLSSTHLERGEIESNSSVPLKSIMRMSTMKSLEISHISVW